MCLRFLNEEKQVLRLDRALLGITLKIASRLRLATMAITLISPRPPLLTFRNVGIPK